MKDKLERLLEAPHWTDEDRQWLLDYLRASDTDDLKTLLLQKLRESENVAEKIDPDLSKKMLEAIHVEIGQPYIRPATRAVRIYARWVAAAAIIGLILSITYLVRHKSGQKELAAAPPNPSSRHPVHNDALPGKDKAILTLADGTTVSLDDAQNGTLAQQGNTKVYKLNGKLSYNTTKNSTPNTISYNTIATPRGGQYQVVLPDGSQVWLNAASSLRFPTTFTGRERRVEVRGEAYFEIAKDPSMPFTVAISPTPGHPAGSEVKVLGTHFNITAYEDETLLKTTLLEGSVQFVQGSRTTTLTPGQQSQLTKDGDLLVSDHVDLSAVMAWKNGLFHFEGADINMVMKQLSRWYDVDIVYGNKKVTDLFYAEIPRNTLLSDALKALSLTGKVDFRIDDKKIIVNL